MQEINILHTDLANHIISPNRKICKTQSALEVQNISNIDLKEGNHSLTTNKHASIGFFFEVSHH